VRRGCSYHGAALNVDMDLAPFAAIDPCGYPGLAVTQCRDLGIGASAEELGDNLAARIAARIGPA
jgi:lipoyl(octanoyl) transferase